MLTRIERAIARRAKRTDRWLWRLPNWLHRSLLLGYLALHLGLTVFWFVKVSGSEDAARQAREFTGLEFTVLTTTVAFLVGLVVALGYLLFRAKRAHAKDSLASRAARRARLHILEAEWVLRCEADNQAWEREREDWKMEQTAKIYRQVMDQHSRGILRPGFRDEPGRDDLAS